LPVLTDQSFELELKKVLESKDSISSLSSSLVEALSSNSRQRKLTAQRFLQLTPEWTLWKRDLEPWLRSLPEWPWPVILNWISHQKLSVTLQEKELIKKSLEKQKQMLCLAKSTSLQSLFVEVEELKVQARSEMRARIQGLRALLFEELQTWKSQRLREQELKVLARLKKKFPQDLDIENEQKVFKENQALEKMQSRMRDQRNHVKSLNLPQEKSELPEGLRSSLQEVGQLHISEFYNLALFCCFVEDWEWALKMVYQAEPSEARDWLEVEIGLKLHRYVDVLQGVTAIEHRWAQSPETFFGTSYIKAQAYYGLGKKEKALEILETLLATRPQFRQAHELIQLWKNPL
jgi:hypothetical protein